MLGRLAKVVTIVMAFSLLASLAASQNSFFRSGTLTVSEDVFVEGDSNVKGEVIIEGGNLTLSHGFIHADNVTRNNTFKNVQITGNLWGGSPLKIRGGAVISDDNETDGAAVLKIVGKTQSRIRFALNDTPLWSVGVGTGNNDFVIRNRDGQGIAMKIDTNTNRVEADIVRIDEELLVRGNLTYDRTDQLISGGSIIYTSPFMQIDVESGTSDVLTDIIGGNTGSILVLISTANNRDIVLDDNAGNLRLAGDFTLSHSRDTITLIKAGGSWLETSRSDNQ